MTYRTQYNMKLVQDKLDMVLCAIIANEPGYAYKFTKELVKVAKKVAGN